MVKNVFTSAEIPYSLGVWALATRMSDAFLVERTSHEDTTPYPRAK
jgi:hypothetical protein